ncbi:uncharacterized protein LODBEIA_P55830 [Lodderomyces beijingensis]|uniref:Transcription initiation factor TFIID subunit 9 n=1 Tax=Lodderomyces beijingensis TaxID=1775926 RepID=A0ABP0ZTY8_9ASCO
MSVPATSDGNASSNGTAAAQATATNTNAGTTISASASMSGLQQQPSSTAAAEKKEAIVPRDVRLLHLIFATQGIQNYQDHVPLQLMDFAHRYTKSILKDALIYNDHARPSGSSSSGASTVNTDDIRLAIAARSNYQFKPVPPKELMLELAQERNSRPLPPVIPRWGLNLPPEKYCLTAKDWDSIYDEPEDGVQEESAGLKKKARVK